MGTWPSNVEKIWFLLIKNFIYIKFSKKFNFYKKSLKNIINKKFYLFQFSQLYKLSLSFKKNNRSSNFVPIRRRFGLNMWPLKLNIRSTAAEVAGAPKNFLAKMLKPLKLSVFSWSFQNSSAFSYFPHFISAKILSVFYCTWNVIGRTWAINQCTCTWPFTSLLQAFQKDG